jgi:hypothetical protein
MDGEGIILIISTMDSMYEKIDKPEASTCVKVIRGLNIVSA